MPVQLQNHLTINQFYKSHKARDPQPTMHHSEQKCEHKCSEWCIVGFGIGALWDLWDWSIYTPYPAASGVREIWCLDGFTLVNTVYPKKYAHGFVVLCFVVFMQSFIMNSHEVFIHIHQGCFAGTGAIFRLPQCQWSKPDGYGKISQCITTTKHSKTKTVCILLGIYCTGLLKKTFYCLFRINPYLICWFIVNLIIWHNISALGSPLQCFNTTTIPPPPCLIYASLNQVSNG